jgi:hypothetical protein
MKCGSERIVLAKCSDMCCTSVESEGISRDGYAKKD